MDAVKAKNLLKHFQSDDENAIDVLYSAYSKRLYKFAFSYLKTEEDASDVVQNVFISLWEKRKTLKEDTNLEAYLFTVARNSVLSIFRKKISEKTYLEYLRQVSVTCYNGNEEQIDFNNLSERINELVEQLPEQRRLIFKMNKEKGKGNKAIAEELHISVKTVEDHLTKARRFLKKNMEGYGLAATLFFELFV